MQDKGTHDAGIASEHVSSNLRKWQSRNPLIRAFLEKFVRVVLQDVASTGAQFVLDAGCGEGIIARRISQALPNLCLVGGDLNLEALQYAKKNEIKSTVTCLDLMALPFGDCAFDAVLSFEVLEHLPDPDRALTELCRVARDYIVVSAPQEPFFSLGNLLRFKNLRSWGSDPDHLSSWGRRTFAEFISHRAEIEIVAGAFPWTVILARPHGKGKGRVSDSGFPQNRESRNESMTP